VTIASASRNLEGPKAFTNAALWVARICCYAKEVRHFFLVFGDLHHKDAGVMTRELFKISSMSHVDVKQRNSFYFTHLIVCNDVILKHERHNIFPMFNKTLGEIFICCTLSLLKNVSRFNNIPKSHRVLSLILTIRSRTFCFCFNQYVFRRPACLLL
jgi:hypothetical protein